MQHVPLIKDVLLIGGGHTHALVIRKWAMQPLPGVRLTLVSRDVQTPYSGMLPAFVAGHYTHAETHIDLARLCQWAGVRFIRASVTGLLPDQQRAILDDRPAIAALGYDLVSINTGSTPDTSRVPGADRFTVPVKPVNRFSDSWQQWLARVADTNPQEESGRADSKQAGSVGVVGAGVGGFELLLSMHHVFKQRGHRAALHWFIRRQEPLKAQPAKVRLRALAICQERDIQVHTDFDVAEIKQGELRSVQGSSVAVDEILWVTAAAAPEWPATAGLATTDRGFIEVNDRLQSTSHPTVFACGDVASQQNYRTPKAGVFAVRQAPVLFHNLRQAALAQNGAFRKFKPQKNYLTLISLGEKSAIASRNGFSIEGDWLWRWKHQIDSAFMQKFSRLPELRMPGGGAQKVPRGLLKSTQLDVDDLIFCGGCGAKAGASVLSSVIAGLQPDQPPDITEDACIIDPGGKRIVQSVDQIRAHIADPFLFGRVAALHALSDVYVANAEPESALALVTLPFSEASVQERDLGALMAGSVRELEAAGCRLAGGHTSVGPECMLGFVVNGIEQPAPESDSDHAVSGEDVLILTKPLGVGVIMAAHMRSLAEGLVVEDALAVMLQSNREAARILFDHGARYLTDVTGFGLLGHLQNLADRINTDKTGQSKSLDEKNREPAAGNGFVMRTRLKRVPVLDAALSLSADNVKSSLFRQNAHFLKKARIDSPGHDKARERLLLDPQTNGGVLAVVPKASASNCLEALQLVCPRADMIGSVERSTNPDAASATVMINE